MAKQAFLPPKEYTSFKMPKRPSRTPSASLPPKPLKQSSSKGAPAQPHFEAALLARAKDPVSIPSCLPSTFLGSVAATVHQDLLDQVSTLVNMVAPLLGTGRLDNGSLTMDWLGHLGSIPTGKPAAGLFQVLRQPRLTSQTPGTGLLDLLAVKPLLQPGGPNNLPRLENDAKTGQLATTLTAWGITDAAVLPALEGNGGKIVKLSLNQQIEVVEGYETKESGIVSISGVGGAFTKSWPAAPHGPLITATLDNFKGRMDFQKLAHPFITSLEITGAGSVSIGVNLPPISLSASLISSLTTLGQATVLIITAGTCLFAPFIPARTILLALALEAITNQIPSLEALLDDCSLSGTITYKFDPTAGVKRADCAAEQPIWAADAHGSAVQIQSHCLVS